MSQPSALRLLGRKLRSPVEMRRYVEQPIDIEVSVQEALKKSMYNADDPARRFMGPQELMQFWEEFPIEKIPAFHNYSSSEIQTIEKEFLRVLSIAVFIGFDLKRFRPVFLRGGLDDASLFYHAEQLSELGAAANAFVDDQYMFKPEIIEQRTFNHPQRVPSKHRLPFIEKSDLMGSGGFGHFTRRKVAPGCFQRLGDDKLDVISQNVGLNVPHSSSQYS